MARSESQCASTRCEKPFGLNLKSLFWITARPTPPARSCAKTTPRSASCEARATWDSRGGNNLAAAHARGEWIILLNDDTEADPGWIAALMAAAQKHPRAGVLGCLLLYPGGRKIQHAGGITHPNGLTDHADWGREADFAAIAQAPPRPCDYVTGAAMAIHREVWRRAGPLDPGFFPIYFEENEFCWRAQQAGWEVWVVPQARVIHHESQTQVAWSRTFLERYHRNRLRFVLKNWKGRKLLGALKAEARWLADNRPYDQIWPLGLAYAQILLGAAR